MERKSSGFFFVPSFETIPEGGRGECDWCKKMEGGKNEEGKRRRKAVVGFLVHSCVRGSLVVLHICCCS